MENTARTLCSRSAITITIRCHINKVNQRQARLVLGWVTIGRRVYQLDM